MPGTEQIDDLISQENIERFESLKPAVDAAVTSLEKLIATGIRVNSALGGAKSFSDISASTKQLSDNEAKLAATTNDLAAAESALDKAKTRLVASTSSEAKELAFVNAQIAENNRQNKLAAQAQNAVNGSVEQAKLTVKDLTYQRDIQTTSTEKGRAKVAELNAAIDAQNEFIRQNTDQLGRQKIDIGNYTGAINLLKPALAEIKLQLEQMVQAGTASAEQQAFLGNQVNLLNELINQQANGFSSLSMEIRANEKALQTLRAAGLGNTEVFQQLQVTTASARREFNEFAAQQKILSSESPAITALAAAARGLGGAYAIGAGSVALFGSENTKLEKELNKLVAIMAIMQGIEELLKVVRERGAIVTAISALATRQKAAAEIEATEATEGNTAVTELSTAAMEADTVATEGATAATIGFKAALISTGIGAIIVAIFYVISKVVSAISDWVNADEIAIKKQAELAEATKKLIDTIKGQSDAVTEANKKSIDALELQAAKLKASGANQYQLLAIEKTIAAARGQIADEQIKNLGVTQDKADLFFKRYSEGLQTVADQEAEVIQKRAATNSKEDTTEIANLKKQIEANQKAVDNNKEAYDLYTKILDDKKKATDDQELNSIEVAKLGAEERRKLALDEANQEAAYVTNKNNIILGDDRSTLAQRLDALKSNADQQKKLLAAQTADVRNNPSSTRFDKAEAAKEEANQVKIINETLNDQLFKENDADRKKELAAIHEITASRISLDKETNDAILADTNNSAERRTEALNKSYSDQKKLIIGQANFELENAALTPVQRLAIEKKANDQLIKAKQDYFKQQRALALENFAQTAKDEQDAAAAERDNTLLQLDAALISGLISVDKYNADKVKIEKKYAAQSLQTQIDLTKETIALYALLGYDVKDQLAKLASLQAQQAQIAVDTTIKKLDQLKAKYKELADSIAGSLQTIVDGAFDKQKQAITDQITALDAQKQKDEDVVNASTASAQDKANKIAIIEARAAAQTAQLQARQNQIDEQKARFDRAIAIAKIIQNVAQAVTHDLAGNKFLIPFDIAIGAAQIAAIIATPIPHFATGTTDAPGGPVVVGDGGRKELVITPEGRLIETPAVSTVMNVPEHSVILPDARKALESGLLQQHSGRPQKSAGNMELVQEMRLTRKAILNKTENHFHPRKDGWERIRKSNGKETRVLNDFF